MTAAIKFHSVSLTYRETPQVHALRDAEVEIRPGEFVSVVGPSGSGKSTFLNLAGLLDRPSAGSYEFNGLPTEQLSDHDRTSIRGHQIGLVFQGYHLLSYRTAVENVAMALLYSGTARSSRLSAAHEVIDRIGLTARRHALPRYLSGGERQRVAIARAIVHRPTLLLCDEPTGNLDSHTAREVIDLLEELNADGMTVVLVTHDRALAARSSRTIKIFDGVLS